MIIISARLRARSDSIDRVTALCRAHAQRSRAEPGCLEFGFARSDDDPLLIVFFERWADQESLRTHIAVPGGKAFNDEVNPLLERPNELLVFEAEPIEFDF